MTVSSPPRPGAPDGGPPQVVVPADIDTVDLIAWGLSFRQLAILASSAGAVWLAYRGLGPWLPPVAWIVIGVLVTALAVTVALGRRDGLPLDVWIRHGLTLRTHSALAVPGDAGSGRPVVRTAGRPVVPAPLRPQLTRIAPDGTVTADGTARVLLACGTTSVGLRTGPEQAALLEGFGRWLNALPGPAQIVISAARHDLAPHAQAVLDAAARLPHPALRQAACGYAAFLLDLDAEREPLRRQVLTVLPATARQNAVRALAALGVAAQPLDGGQVTAALAASADPYDPPVPGPRAAPGVPVTARATTPPPGPQRPAGPRAAAARPGPAPRPERSHP